MLSSRYGKNKESPEDRQQEEDPSLRPQRPAEGQEGSKRGALAMKKLPRGHEWAAGRPQAAHKDRRHKRQRTRAAKNKAAGRGW